MSDEEIRRRERAVAADPGDGVALEALAAARTRAGRGWADESLPRDLRCSPRERGVYVWERHGLGLEMVRVPWAPEVVTVEFDGGDPHGERLVTTERPAFMVGRYPVTWGEYDVFCRTPGRLLSNPWAARPDWALGSLDHPVVNITHADAMSFCAWAGLRLPTAVEWTRAALGDGTVFCLECQGEGQVDDPERPGDDIVGVACPGCRGTGSAPRKFPWGNEPPSPERCVSAWWDQTPPGQVRHLSVEAPRATRPVRDTKNHPARPDGASPCGAHDMVGHVAQYTTDGLARGGSFRSPHLDGSRVRDGSSSGDDVGFRVALGEFGDDGGPLTIVGGVAHESGSGGRLVIQPP